MSPNYSLLAINQENNTGSNGNDFADKHLKRHFINFIFFILGRRVSSISNHFMEKQSFNISTDLPSRIQPVDMQVYISTDLPSRIQPLDIQVCIYTNLPSRVQPVDMQVYIYIYIY